MCDSLKKHRSTSEYTIHETSKVRLRIGKCNDQCCPLGPPKGMLSTSIKRERVEACLDEEILLSMSTSLVLLDIERLLLLSTSGSLLVSSLGTFFS